MGMPRVHKKIVLFCTSINDRKVTVEQPHTCARVCVLRARVWPLPSGIASCLDSSGTLLASLLLGGGEDPLQASSGLEDATAALEQATLETAEANSDALPAQGVAIRGTEGTSATAQQRAALTERCARSMAFSQ